MTRAERLEALRWRSSRYEVVACYGSQKILIAYTAQRSRHGLLKACQNRGQMIIDALQLKPTDLLIPAKKAADGFTLGEWSVRFSGRTERDCIMEGENTFVGDLIERAA